MSLPALSIFPKMEKEDFRVLQGIELGMRRFDTVPIEQIRFFARMPLSAVQYRLDRVHKFGLVIRDVGRVTSYVMNSEAYDLLAIHTLVEQGHLAQFGQKIGVGKESDVYQALDANDKEVAVKFHRLGRTSFRNIRKLRGYLGGRGHYSWLYASRLSAESEFAGLQRVAGLTPHTPKPFAQNRHAVVMEVILGQGISEFADIADPVGTFSQIIEDVKIFYQKGGLIHGDLGEYNILLDADENILIIDFPQWVPADHPNAEEYLRRDVANVCNFFHRRYRVESDLDAIVTEIMKNEEIEEK
ncbi:MAG TPA: RIO1 family regulatory kinase/ATPase [Candidatus Lokiarchaeia archaeon]|nr:RIO1 family regulatory kinase/ATPase [Candidatus Lokiarchaeia archaeon]